MAAPDTAAHCELIKVLLSRGRNRSEKADLY